MRKIWMYPLGWRDIALFAILKMGTMLPIRYIFTSPIPKKSASLAAGAVHVRQSFHFQKITRTLKIYIFSESSFYILQRTIAKDKIRKFTFFIRVGHRVLFCLVRSVLFRSLKGTFRSFFKFLATYETQKNVPFFSVLF